MKSLLHRVWTERSPRLVAGFALFIPAMAIHITGIAGSKPLPQGLEIFSLALFSVCILLSGHAVYERAYRDLLRGRWATEYFLMSIASIGAVALGEWPEAAAVMLFYELGEYVQQLAIRNAQKSLASLMEMAANKATVWRDGQYVEVDPEDAEPGERLLLGAGARLPLDSRVLKGFSDLDESAITGESLPRSVEPGDMVMAGAVNLNGTLELESVESYESSALSRILELTEDASLHKAKTERMISRFAAIYTPIMIGIAIGMQIVPALFFGAEWLVWFQRSLNLLVISCPCALVLSVPLSYFRGLNLASSHGILIKGSDVMESLARCTEMFFDKTGTLTEAKLELSGIDLYPEGEKMGERELLSLAAALEESSGHPIATALKEAAGLMEADSAEAPRFSDVQESPGRGMKAVRGEETYFLGNARLLRELGLDAEAGDVSDTAVWLAVEDKGEARLLARFLFRDRIKGDAHEALKALHGMKVRKLTMLSGDRKETVRETADLLGFDLAEAELLPDQKLEILKSRIEASHKEDSKSVIAYVGDGINDAPCLALADVGIAMGGLGSDAAVEAADIVLLRDELEALPQSIDISRKTARNAAQNIILALSVKMLVLILSFAGIGGLWAAVFADVGVSLLAVANALRLERAHIFTYNENSRSQMHPSEHSAGGEKSPALSETEDAGSQA